MERSEATGRSFKVPIGNEGLAFRQHRTADGRTPLTVISRATVTKYEYVCHCGKVYLSRQNQRKFSCGCKVNRVKGGVLDRFIARVAFSDKPDGCWLWQGGLDLCGYGKLRVGEDMVLTHRFSYELFHGPTDLYVMHLCDNPACVRPEHLVAGTQTDNMRDMMKKGRGADTAGSKNGMAKLTEADIPVICECYRRGSTYEDIAVQYGVSPNSIRLVVKGKTWQKVPR